MAIAWKFGFHQLMFNTPPPPPPSSPPPSSPLFTPPFPPFFPFPPPTTLPPLHPYCMSQPFHYSCILTTSFHHTTMTFPSVHQLMMVKKTVHYYSIPTSTISMWSNSMKKIKPCYVNVAIPIYVYSGVIPVVLDIVLDVGLLHMENIKNNNMTLQWSSHVLFRPRRWVPRWCIMWIWHTKRNTICVIWLNNYAGTNPNPNLNLNLVLPASEPNPCPLTVSNPNPNHIV